MNDRNLFRGVIRHHEEPHMTSNGNNAPTQGGVNNPSDRAAADEIHRRDAIIRNLNEARIQGDIEDERDHEAQHQRDNLQRRRRGAMWRIARGYHENYAHPAEHYLGPRDRVCRHCHADKWRKETPGVCCVLGKVQLAPYEDPPQELQLTYQDRNFLANIRKYNMVFSFTSLGADVGPLQDRTLNDGRGPYTFRIQGSICHKIGTLLPNQGDQPAFAQIYVFDTRMEAQIDRRMSIMAGLNRQVITTIQNMMREHNPLAQRFISAGERLNEVPQVQLVLRDNARNIDQRRYNRPQADEVAAIMVESDGLSAGRDIILQTRREENDGLTRIFEGNPLYDRILFCSRMVKLDGTMILLCQTERGYHQAHTQPTDCSQDQVKILSSIAHHAFSNSTVWINTRRRRLND